jgi:hypothetical protein
MSSEEKSMRRIWIPQAIAIVMLLWALNPENPYGYYILLRWVCCAVFAYLAIKAFAQEKEGWVWVLGVTAVVYNPILRIHLSREIWSVINIVTIIVAAVSVVVLKSATKDRNADLEALQSNGQNVSQQADHKKVSNTGDYQGYQIQGTGPRHHCST